MNPLMAACPKCGKLHEVRSEHVGRRLGCSGCAHVFRLEAPDPPKSEPAARPLKVAEEISEPLPPKKASEKRPAKRQSYGTNFTTFLGLVAFVCWLVAVPTFFASVTSFDPITRIAPSILCGSFLATAIACHAFARIIKEMRRISATLDGDQET